MARVITARQWGRISFDLITVPGAGFVRVSLTSILKGHMPSLSNWTVQRLVLSFAVQSQAVAPAMISAGAIVHPEQVGTQMPDPFTDDADWFWYAKMIAPGTDDSPSARTYSYDIKSQRRGREFEAACSLVFAGDGTTACSVQGGGRVLFGLH